MERGGGQGTQGKKRREEKRRRDETIRRALNFLAAKKKGGTETLFGGLPSFLPSFFVLFNKGRGGLLALRFFFTEHVEVYFYYAERERERGQR